MPIPYSSVVELEVRHGDISRSFFILQDCFGIQGFLLFHMKLSIVLSRCVKNCVGALMGIVLNL